MYLWAQLSDAAQLAAHKAGSCSYLNSTSDAFTANHAGLAGAVIYSNNMTTVDVTCPASAQLQPGEMDCPVWGPSGNTVGDASHVGYGPGLASAPASLVLSAPGSNELRYISDGTSKLPAVVAHVLDQAGHMVTSGDACHPHSVLVLVAVSGMSYVHAYSELESMLHRNLLCCHNAWLLWASDVAVEPCCSASIPSVMVYSAQRRPHSVGCLHRQCRCCVLPSEST